MQQHINRRTHLRIIKPLKGALWMSGVAESSIKRPEGLALLFEIMIIFRHFFWPTPPSQRFLSPLFQHNILNQHWGA